MSIRALLLSTALAAFAVPGMSVAAQENQPGDDEIIVITTERRGTLLEETPAAISTFNDIDRIDADHPSEILARVPGVMIDRNSGQESLTAIRSPVLTGGAGAGSFLYLENGVPIYAPGFANVNGLFQTNTMLADRIEVIRGPSGAFYGANAIHGVINVLSPHPSANGQFAEVSLSEYHRKGETGVSRMTRGKGFFIGLAVHDDFGYRTDSGVDQQELVLRQVDETGPWRRDTILTVNNLNQETAGYIEGEDIYKDREAARINPNPEAFRDVKSIRLQSTFERDTDDGMVSITPYARWSDMDFKQHFLPSQSLEENSHWSLGAQSAFYANPGERFTLTWGLDAEYTEGWLTEVQEAPDIFSYRQGVHYDYDVTAVSLSPFAQAETALTERLSLIAAARADWTRYAYTNNTEDGLFGRNLRPADRTDEFLTVSPKFTLQRRGDDNLLWASYSRGARPPQTSDLYRLQSNETVGLAKEETIDSIEAGWRGQLGERISATAIAFWMDKDNYYFRDADGFNVADGKTRHVGIEAEVTARLSETLSLSANGTIAEHTYRFDRPVTSQVSEAISKGDEVDTAPGTIGGARLSWQPDILSGVSSELEWVHVGEYYLDAANTTKYEGHDIFHLRAQKQFGFFTLRGTVRNILDEEYATRADYAFGNYRYFPDEGRTLTIALRLEN
ncbi:TonB-dependent receptor [Parvularcula flava]|uniref:TonB-dependent receptor n=1 Tax=Aquisalinus luteolus TaxID=1566827 RepID=A0A8J3A4H4_9PROT|nr:TonB-dependent receptor [Aquisalinus luteolus]NHK28305.1 TonB-dependent receptor [Aquisalinus luteolus]GGH98075.1 hypothetical protein GCM10011355_20810 [Aquisalinus luteolus]